MMLSPSSMPRVHGISRVGCAAFLAVHTVSPCICAHAPLGAECSIINGNHTKAHDSSERRKLQAKHYRAMAEIAEYHDSRHPTNPSTACWLAGFGAPTRPATQRSLSSTRSLVQCRPGLSEKDRHLRLRGTSPNSDLARKPSCNVV